MRPYWLWILTLAGCASGGAANTSGDDQGGHPDATPVRIDAHQGGQPIDGNQSHPDAEPIDASAPPIDAAVPPADAALFCSDDSMCTDVGTCCFTAGGSAGFCLPGTVVFGVCFPATN